MTVSFVQGGYASGPGPTLVVNLGAPIAPGNVFTIVARIKADPLDPNPLSITPAIDASRFAFIGGWGASVLPSVSPSTGFAVFTRVVGEFDSEAQTTFTISNSHPDAPALLEIEAMWVELASSVGPITANTGGSAIGPQPSPIPLTTIFDVVGVGAPFRTDIEFVGFVGYLLGDHPALPASSTTTGVTSVPPGVFDATNGVSMEFGAIADMAQASMTWDAAGGDGMIGSSVNVPFPTAFSNVQTVPAPGAWAAPAAGNLIVLTTFTLDPAPAPPDLAGWTRVDDPSNGGLLSTYWKVADGTETPASVAAAATAASDSNFIEVTGFTQTPTFYGKGHGNFTNASYWFPTGPGEYLLGPGGDFVGLVTAGFSASNQAEVCIAPPYGFQTTRTNMAAAYGVDAIRNGAPFGAYADFGTSDPESAQTGGISLLAWIDVPTPTPPVPAAAPCCPKSIRAIAMRLTRLNRSGVPLDPLTEFSRVQTSGFVEVSVDPDYEEGDETITRSANGNAMALIDRGCDMMKGANVTIKLCGVPYATLEMLLGLNYLGGSTDAIVGAALPDTKNAACRDLVMIELWSKNASKQVDASGACGQWIHWLLPRTLKWRLSGGLSYATGPLEFEVEGYAEQNPAWYPSMPSQAFPSYIPGLGAPSGWPIGPAGPTLPDVAGLTADEWTLLDQEVIRNSGPLAWRCVDTLPAPLDDCSYLPGLPCHPDDVPVDFCGPAGDVSSPWEVVSIPWLNTIGGP